MAESIHTETYFVTLFAVPFDGEVTDNDRGTMQVVIDQVSRNSGMRLKRPDGWMRTSAFRRRPD